MPKYATSPASSYKHNARGSILDLPDEALLKIIGCALKDVNVICLALTCKRLCGLYQDFVDTMDERSQKRISNCVKGNWKQQLVPLLVKGWIPKDRTRVCWVCWRFSNYGSPARAWWVEYLTDELCHESLRNEKLSEWLNNWEIKTWLGQTATAINGQIVSARDDRVRCPSCVIKGLPVRLMMLNTEERRRQQPERLKPIEDAFFEAKCRIHKSEIAEYQCVEWLGERPQAQDRYWSRTRKRRRIF